MTEPKKITREELRAAIDAALVDAVDLADRIGDEAQARAFENTLASYRDAGGLRGPDPGEPGEQPENLRALLIGTLLDAAHIAGRIGDHDRATAFEVAAGAARNAGDPGGYERLAELARYFTPSPAAIAAAIRALGQDSQSLVWEAMTFDRDCEDYGVDEARANRAAARRVWERRTEAGLPPVPPMIPDPVTPPDRTADA